LCIDASVTTNERTQMEKLDTISIPGIHMRDLDFRTFETVGYMVHI